MSKLRSIPDYITIDDLKKGQKEGSYYYVSRGGTSKQYRTIEDIEHYRPDLAKQLKKRVSVPARKIVSPRKTPARKQTVTRAPYSYDLLKRLIETHKNDEAKKLLKDQQFDISQNNYGLVTTAIQNNNIPILKELFARGGNETIKDKFLEASRTGDLNAIRILLNVLPDIDFGDERGLTALMFASHYSHTDIIKELLEAGVKVNLASRDGRPALMIASESGNLDIVQELLDYGASINKQSNSGWTALIFAVSDNHPLIVKELLDQGASINQQENSGGTALMFASENNTLNIVQELLDHGASVNQQDNSGWTALMLAAYHDNIEIAKMLLDAGADIYLQNKDGKMAVDLGERFHASNELIKLLLPHPSDISDPKTEMSHLMIVASKGLTNPLKKFLKQPINIDQQDLNGKTALIHSILNNQNQSVELLLNAGADPNVADNEGMSPLAYAVQLGNEDIARMLIENGADFGEEIDNVGKKYKEGSLIKKLRTIPAIDIKETCLNEEDPIRQEALIPRGTLTIDWPGTTKSYCYDISSLLAYIRSQGEEIYGIDPSRDYIDVYEIPPRYYVDKESGKKLLTRRSRRYRAYVLLKKVKINQVENTVYALTEI